MIKKLVITLLSIFTLNVSAQTTSKINVSWIPSCNTNVNMYILYYGTNTSLPRTNIYEAYIDECGTNVVSQTNVYKGIYSFTNTVLGLSTTTATISNVVKGIKYYLVLTCKTTSGMESYESEEIECSIPLYSTNSVPSKVKGIRIIEIK